MKLKRISPVGEMFSPCNSTTRLIVATASLLAGSALMAGCSGGVDAPAGPGVWAPAGNTADTVTDANGTTTTTDANGTTTVTDASGTVTVTDTDGNVTMTDVDGNVTTGTAVTDADGNVTVTDTDGNVTMTVTDTDGSTTTTVTDTDGNTTTTVADAPDTTAPDTTTTEAATVCVRGVPGTTQLPRLTQAQYDKTVLELTGLGGQPSALLAPDSRGDIAQRDWDGYQAGAEAVASDVMADATALAKVLPCTDDTDACAQQFVTEFGKRAFRRPLTAAEVTKFTDMYTNRASLTETGTFNEAVQLIVESFLKSPSFLTRAELEETAEGDFFALSNYEVASRLSYMLWGSMPDAALFDAADQGSLNTPAGILAQAERMLVDAKGRAAVGAFHRSYAKMGENTRWSTIDHDTSVFPTFTAAQPALMNQETEMLFDHLVFDQGGSFKDLLTSPIGFVNADLAPLYGLDAASFGADLVATPLDAATRPGVFTRVGFLASQSLYNRTSPIYRGAFLQEDVLCEEFGNAPAGATETPLPTDASLVTNRQRVDAQTEGPACVVCHNTINGTGFALEGYDAIGAIQTVDNGEAIDTVATIKLGEGTADVVDAASLMNAIAASPQAERCYAKKWVQYAYDRAGSAADICVIDDMAANFAQEGGYTVKNLITDLTQSDSFRLRAVETEVAN